MADYNTELSLVQESVSDHNTGLLLADYNTELSLVQEKCSALAQTSCESRGRLVCEEKCEESLWCEVCQPPHPH